MRKWLKRTLVGTASALILYTTAYVGGGYFYGITREVMFSNSRSEGYFNRPKSKAFRQEFFQDFKVLQNQLPELPKAKKIITLDVLVTEDVKRMFDDHHNPYDNRDWVGYIAQALSSLREYKKADIGFKVRALGGLIGPTFNPEVIAYTAFRTSPPGGYKLVFVTPKEMGSSGLLGFAFPGKGIALVSVDPSKRATNETTLHEMGHLLGLNHQPYYGTKRALFDPYCLIYEESFMIGGKHFCTGLTLKSNEIEILKKLHFK